MELKVKKVNISSGGPLIAILNEEDARRLDLKPLDRIKLKINRRSVTTAVDIASRDGVKKGYVGLFIEVFEKLNVRESEKLSVEVELKPLSLQYIKKKLDGESLSKHEVDEIIKDIIDNKLTEIEMTYFVSGCYTNGLTLYESSYLTEAILDSGSKLKLNKYPICDKHSIGGCPGNRTTPIVVSIIAAAGFTIPKTSTRSITSVSGTSDTVEVFAPVAHSKDKIEHIVRKTNACMVWGGALELASADDRLIKIERPLSLDPEGILLASILAKKAAVGATHIIIDIPMGKGTKIEEKDKARRLERKFKQLGKLLGMETKVVLTDGEQPIGNGIGPSLEARDVLLVLQNKGVLDLKKKSVFLSGSLLKLAGVKNGHKKALDILEKGLAYEKFKEIIKEQGGNSNVRVADIKLSNFKYNVKAKKSGVVRYIDNKLLTRVAKVAGAPECKGAGIYLNVHLKDKVKKNDILFTIYAENKKKMDYALRLLEKDVILVN